MKNLFLICLLGVASMLSAQPNVGIGTTMPHPSAILDLSSTTKGFAIPRMTGAQRAAISSPVTGLMVYQTNTEIIPFSSPGFYIYTGTSWKRMARAEELTGGTSSWMVDGDHQYSLVDGNVGIGVTTGINRKFFLKGNAFITHVNPNDLLGGGNIARLSLHGASTGSGILEFLKPDTTAGATISYSNLASTLNLRQAASDSYMRLYSNGNVGIGLTGNISDLASSRLHIKGGTFVNYTTQHGYILLGEINGLNLALGHYEILARNNGAAAPLYLQQEGGAVRIGTTGITADTRLHITDGGESSLTTHGYLVLGPTTSGNLVLDPNEIQARSNGAATTLRLQQDGGALLVQGGALTVSANGNVGIGDLTPDEKLHVAGHGLFNATDPIIQLQNSGVDKGFVQLSGDNIRIGTNSGNTNGKFIVRVLGQDRVAVDGGGNMGIGTTSPTSKLHVEGSGYFKNSGQALAIDGNTPHIAFYQNGAYKSFIEQHTSKLFIGVNGGKLQLDANQIAIGTVQSTADEFKLAVTGKIICEELKVELVGSWPDYVFSDHYPLTPLSELRNFIETHHHLPNIPSAAEVGKEGFEVGEMHRKLLEKVEELTLYIIQQQEEIEALKAAIQRSAN